MAVVMLRNPTFLEEEVETTADQCCLHIPTDMFQDKDDLVVRLELPGVKKEDINLSVTADMLDIKAEKKLDEKSEDVKYFTCEQWHGTYSRSMELPFEVDPNNVSSQFSDGVLEIRLPRSEASKPRRIGISGSESSKSNPLTEEDVDLLNYTVGDAW